MINDLKNAIRENNIAEIQFSLKEKLNTLLEKTLIGESAFDDYWQSTLSNRKPVADDTYTLKDMDVLQQGNVDLFKKMVNDNNETYQTNSMEYQSKNTLQDKYVDIITNAKMFGAKENGKLYDANSKLVIDFLYPEQVEHFLEWLKRYDNNLNNTMEATFDVVVGNIIRVTVFYPYK